VALLRLFYKNWKQLLNLVKKTDNLGFTAYHPASPNHRGAPKTRRSTITASILSKVQQASDARQSNTPKQHRILSATRIKEAIQESDPELADQEEEEDEEEGEEEETTMSQEKSSEFYVATPIKDFSTSCSNIDESKSSRRRTMSMMADKKNSYDH